MKNIFIALCILACSSCFAVVTNDSCGGGRYTVDRWGSCKKDSRKIMDASKHIKKDADKWIK